MEEDYNWLEVILSKVTLEDNSQADVVICYYVSGYTAQRIDNQRKCTSFKKLLISSNTSSEVTESLFEEHQNLFKTANRGGLVEPSAFCFATTVFAMQFFNALASNTKNMKRLLILNNPRAVFTNASTAVTKTSTSCDLTDIKCRSDHTNFKFIVRTVLIASQRTS